MYSHVVAHNYRVCICMQKEALDHLILFEHSLPIFDGLNNKNYKVSHICAHVDLEHMEVSLSVLYTTQVQWLEQLQLDAVKWLYR